MQPGIDELLRDPERRRPLAGKRLALLGHPASLTTDGRHTLDALMDCPDIRLTAAFGPQHGMRGDKQDNMIESTDYLDPRHGIPVFSLYGAVRYPTDAMLDTFDVLLVDLQDIGTRIYTYVTTLAYLLEACAAKGKALWVLDRPNPAGRPVEGSLLEPGWESFVGAAPMIMRHGLTFGELALWLAAAKGLALELEVVTMAGYGPRAGPGYGWPLHQVPWVNPSPNASSLNMARCFPGTVLGEGTTLSEGRGTGTPLELIGAPDLDFERVLARMSRLRPDWLEGCLLRNCRFEPTFHKHAGKLCSGIQIHTDHQAYRHEGFRPYRLVALLLKAVRLEYPDYWVWRDFPYEYETERLAIDLLTGGTFLREWVDDPAAGPDDLEARLVPDETAWTRNRQPFLRYF
ncbi:MAG: Protein YzbB [Olavius algarvensis Gamma 1 endosymbiont]|nr:MAG: Protein YzbB [Olavius algarvensis Gamma 1 endosymbiont]